MTHVTIEKEKLEQWIEDLEYWDSDKNVIADIKQALAAVQEPVVRWVGLTAAEQRSIEKKHIFVEDAIRLTEAKLREKNT